MLNTLLSKARYLIVLAVLSLLASAAVLLAYGTVLTGTSLWRLVQSPSLAPETGLKTAMLAFLQVADLFLFATVLYVIAVGLYELFVDDRVPVPAWLEIHDLDGLKDKLLGVVVLILAVLFLAQAVNWDGGTNLLAYGASTALVIAALTFFLNKNKR
jgi:uncharacterized membrane protein YqhA